MRTLLISVHGIRTFGQWQERLEQLIRRDPSSCDYEVRHFKYGYFSALAFLIPPLRWIITGRFRRLLEREIWSNDWDRIHLIGHSFGTHIIAYGVKGTSVKQAAGIHTILLAGSVLRSTFPWNEILGSRVHRVINDCGTRDSVLLLSQLFVLFTGMAGRVGFAGMTGRTLRNRFFPFGHSGYFLSEDGSPTDDFMWQYWIPLLTTDEEPLAVDTRISTPLAGIAATIANNMEPIKLTIYAAILLLPSIFITRLYLNAEAQRKLAVSRELAATAAATERSNLIDSAYLAASSLRMNYSNQAYTILSRLLQQEPLQLSSTPLSPPPAGYRSFSSFVSSQGDFVFNMLHPKGMSKQPFRINVSRTDGSQPVATAQIAPDGRLLGVSPDGSWFLMQERNRLLAIDAKNGQTIRIIDDKHRSFRHTGAFSAASLATVRIDSERSSSAIEVIDIYSGKILAQLKNLQNLIPQLLRYSANGKFFAAAYSDGEVFLWTTADWRPAGSARSPFYSKIGWSWQPTSMAVDGTRGTVATLTPIASASAAWVEMLEPAENRFENISTVSSANEILDLDVPAGIFLLRSPQELLLWSIATNQPVFRIPLSSGNESVALTANADRIVASDRDVVRQWTLDGKNLSTSIGSDQIRFKVFVKIWAGRNRNFAVVTSENQAGLLDVRHAAKNELARVAIDGFPESAAVGEHYAAIFSSREEDSTHHVCVIPLTGTHCELNAESGASPGEFDRTGFRYGWLDAKGALHIHNLANKTDTILKPDPQREIVDILPISSGEALFSSTTDAGHSTIGKIDRNGASEYFAAEDGEEVMPRSLAASSDGKTIGFIIQKGKTARLVRIIQRDNNSNTRALMYHSVLEFESDAEKEKDEVGIDISADGQFALTFSNDGLQVWSISEKMSLETITTPIGMARFTTSDRILYWNTDSYAVSSRELIWHPSELIQMTCKRFGGNLPLPRWSKYASPESYQAICDPAPVTFLQKIRNATTPSAP